MINDENNKTTTQASAAPAGGRRVDPVERTTGTEQSVQRTGRLGRNVTRSRIGENVAVIAEAMNKALAQTSQNQDYQHRVFPVDASQIQTHYSLILTTAEIATAGRKVVTVCTLMAAGSNKTPASQRIHIGRDQIAERIVVPGDGWDVKTWEKVQAHVLRLVGSNSQTTIEVVNAGCIVIPEDFSVEDANAIQDILWASTEATAAVIEQQFPNIFPVFTVSDALRKDSQKLVGVWSEDYTGVIMDEIGRPIRSDLKVSVTVQPRVENQNSVSGFMHENVEELCTAAGYVDLIFTPQPPEPAGARYRQAPAPTQQFTPRIIITKLTAPVLTTETMLLGLINFFLVGDDYQWANRFRRAHGKLDNIGALGYLIPNPDNPDESMGKIDTGAALSDRDFANLITTVIEHDPVFSIHCSETGPDSWLTGIFQAAAIENTEQMINRPNDTEFMGAANQAIIQAMDNLFDNQFSPIWGNRPVVHLDQNRLIYGTYTGADGDLRDKRDIDQLAVLNEAGAGNLDLFFDYAATYDAIEVPMDVRLDTRNRLERSMSPKNMKHEGYIEVVNFAPDFAAVAISAAAAANYAVEVSGLTPLYQQQTTRGNNYLGQFRSHGLGANRLHQQNNVGGGNNYGGTYRPYNRFGR